jgi:hypothetical protein
MFQNNYFAEFTRFDCSVSKAVPQSCCSPGLLPPNHACSSEAGPIRAETRLQSSQSMQPEYDFRSNEETCFRTTLLRQPLIWTARCPRRPRELLSHELAAAGPHLHEEGWPHKKRNSSLWFWKPAATAWLDQLMSAAMWSFYGPGLLSPRHACCDCSVFKKACGAAATWARCCRANPSRGSLAL